MQIYAILVSESVRKIAWVFKTRSAAFAEEFGYMSTEEAIEMVNRYVDDSIRFLEGMLS